MNAQQVLLFGDQADAHVPMIRRLVGRAHTSTNLQSFLQSLIDSLQLEVSKLLPKERESIGCFRDVQHLVPSFLKGLDRFGISILFLYSVVRFEYRVSLGVASLSGRFDSFNSQPNWQLHPPLHP